MAEARSPAGKAPSSGKGWFDGGANSPLVHPPGGGKRRKSAAVRLDTFQMIAARR